LEKLPHGKQPAAAEYLLRGRYHWSSTKQIEGKIMSKATCKNLLWIVLPLGLAMGCAENRPQAEAVYGPAPDVTLAPTSAGPEQHIYNNSGSTVQQSTVTVNQAPGGASAASWAVAQEIREKLVSDPTLAPMGSSLIANVGKDGVVTLHGTLSSPSEQKRVCDTIAALPGVQGINNQLNVGRDFNNGRLNMGQ
jgi:hypothetical protein